MAAPREPWQPIQEPEAEFNAFRNNENRDDSLVKSPKIRDAEEDTAPLQGSNDLSDDDSLEDVVADKD